MKEIMILLMRVLSQEKKGSINYTIAEYFMTHKEEITKMSLNSIAAACHVSSASVSRFCRSLGLSDFFELRYLLKDYNIEVLEKFSYEKQSDDYVFDYIEDVKSHLDTLKNIDREQLQRLIDDLCQYEKVVIMGHMQSANVAYNLQYDIAPYFRFVYCTQDHEEQKDYLLNSDENTLIIIFSAGGGFIKRVLPRDKLEKRKNGPKIYMISTSEVKDRNYYDEVIELCEKYRYSSSLPLMQGYAHLIMLGYKDKGMLRFKS